ncbi:BrnT family toxin [Candidatus Poribacteria bacterium]|nr:BrnT family toxin [Candidatus Poribacteria bacterium]
MTALDRSERRILRIVYIRRNSVIRIVSAREANKHESAAYIHRKL